MKFRFIKLGETGKILLLSLFTGLGAGFSAVLLIKVIHLLQKIVRGCTDALPGGFWYALFPALGMLLSLMVVRYLVRDNISHGVTQVLLAISRGESRIKPHNMWSSLLTSAMTIGFGGSVGAEAPIVYTGAALGSNLGRWASLSNRGVTILLGCGAAGAIAGIFKAPLAGVLFTLEILLFNISMSSMMPLLVSTLSATVVSYVFLGMQATFPCYIDTFKMMNLPWYLALGVFCAFISLYFTRFTLRLEDHLRYYRSPWVRLIFCAFGLGILLLVFPPLFGEGYSGIWNLLTGEGLEMGFFPMLGGWGIPLFVLLLLLLKVISMTLTNAGGGVGGTFGPTLVVGGFAGFVLARSFNLMDIGWQLPEQNFVLVGMAGLMAGVMQAPMTAIFLIAEITGGYGLLVPLILCATVSYGVTRLWEKYSIYTKRIAQSGDLITHDSDQAVMTLMSTRQLVSDKYPRLRLEDTLEDIIPVIADSIAQVFAVLDKDGRFCGMLEMDELRKYVFNPAQDMTVPVLQLMYDPPFFVFEDEKMQSVMDKFDKSRAWRLPVITRDGIYLGFISRPRILAAYRDKMRHFSAD
ncbi:MAG: chloride channel protein [Bacteroidales bacterium]|nr:chloride channel protein [Bacteroidales bacterium]